MAISQLPEIQSLHDHRSLIRIPPEEDIPLTPRVERLIDTAPFRRLSRISQLGLVSLVYPAAHHTRFEHSLGTYRLALLSLDQLSSDPRFQQLVDTREAGIFLAAALLHDIGHWPFCHPIEDLQLPGVPRHELLAEHFLSTPEMTSILKKDWQATPAEILEVLNNPSGKASLSLLHSLLSGPIDVDKMDYLPRDSLHAGVPYGRHFDRQRLLGSLCVNQQGDGIAIGEKGRTAAEMMVFSRYVMFSEVYWHHAVRSATAMLQRAFFRLHTTIELAELFRQDEKAMVDQLRRLASSTGIEDLIEGLFGPRRILFKRLSQYSLLKDPDIYSRLARRPYDWLVRLSDRLAERIGQELGCPVRADDVLIDAPPIKLEVEFNVSIHSPAENCYRMLGDVSPVVHALAHTQFDDYVKRVRIFLHPRLAAESSGLSVETFLAEAMDDIGQA